MQHFPFESLHVNLTYYERIDENGKHTATALEPDDGGYFKTVNVKGFKPPQIRARHRQYRLTPEKREKLQELIAQIYDSVDEIMLD